MAEKKYMSTAATSALWAKVKALIPESDTFVVTFTSANDVITADQSYSDVLDADESGKIVIGVYDNNRLPLIIANSNNLYFGGEYTVNASGRWQIVHRAISWVQTTGVIQYKSLTTKETVSLPLDAGTEGQMLVANANGDQLVWADTEDVFQDLISQSDWEEDDSTSPSYVLNRPAIRAGDGENSIIEGHVEEDEGAVTYTINVTGGANATQYSYTSVESIPSTALVRAYATAYYENGTAGNKFRKIISVDSSQNLIVFNGTLSASALSNEPVKILYKQNGAQGKNSHSEGQYTFSFGVKSHAEGSGSIAALGSAHAEGENTDAHGTYSHSEGNYTVASGTSSHAEGSWTVAKGSYSHAEGRYTIANTNQHASGKFNIEDTNSAYATIVGNGTAENARSNAYTLDWNGNGAYAGKLTVGAGPTANMDVATKQYVDNSTAPLMISLDETNAEYDEMTDITWYDFGYSLSELCDYYRNGTHIVFNEVNPTPSDPIDMMYTFEVTNINYEGEGWGSITISNGEVIVGFLYSPDKDNRYKWQLSYVTELAALATEDYVFSLLSQFSLSISGNTITLHRGSDLFPVSIYLPVYTGTVTSGGSGGGGS